MPFTKINTYMGAIYKISACRFTRQFFVLIAIIAAVGMFGSARGEEAVSPCLDVYTIGLDAYGKSDFETSLEKFSEARECLLKESGGEESVESATVADDVGLAYDSLGKYEDALKYYSISLNARQKLLGEDSDKTADSHGHVGAILEAAGDYAGALKHYVAALEGRKATFGAKSREAGLTYNMVGLAYDSVGDLDRALENFKSAVKIISKTDGEESASAAAIYNNIGLNYSSRADYARALEYYRISGEIYQKTPGASKTNMALNRNNIGMALVNTGDYAGALREFAAAMDIYKSAGLENSPNAATCYNNAGLTLKDSGDYPAALENYNKALEIRLKTTGENHPDTAGQYNNIANLYQDTGEFGKALELNGKALKILLATVGEAHPNTAASYNNIGMAYASLADYKNALENYNKGLEIKLKTLGENHPGTAASYSNIGMLYYTVGDYDRALKHYRKSLEIDLKTLGENHPDTAKDYNNIGAVYSALNDPADTIENYAKALEIDLKALGGNHPDTATDYNNMAWTYLASGDYGKALEYYEKALKIREEALGPEHPDTATSYNNIGWTYSEKLDYEKALEYYARALKIRLKVFGGEHPATAAARNNTGMALYKQSKYAGAASEYEEALKAQCGGKEDPSPEDCRPDPVTVNAGWYLAEALEMSGDLEKSVKSYKFAADAVDMMRNEMGSDEAKKYFGGNYYELYPQGVGAFALLAQKTGDMSLLEGAYLHAEKGIGRVFLEMMGKNLSAVTGGLPEEVLSRGAELNARLRAAQDVYGAETSKPNEQQSQEKRGAAYDDLSRARRELADYEKNLLIDYPAYAELRNPSPKRLEDIRKTVIGKDEVALEFILGDDASFLLLITKDGMRITSLPGKKKIELKVKNYRSLLTRPDAGEEELKEAGGELFDMLFGNTAGDIARYKSLLIIPTGGLYFLPFETLAHKSKDGEVRYLATEYKIRYAPSLNVLYLAAAGGKSGGEKDSWLGFGDPVYQASCDARAAGRGVSEDTAMMLSSYSRALGDGKEAAWCRIPGTAEEVTAIAGLLGAGGGNTSVELGEDASEGNFKKLAEGGGRVIHIASHGTLGEGGARQPALVLSLSGNEASGEDGFLTMSEVFNMKIPADMVVLSACKTGEGQMEKGEGVAGMSRAFMFAGARSLVVSLWSVADKETKELMTDFYAEMSRGDVSRLDALTAAKRAMAARGLAPYYWAPFIYLGGE